MFVTSLGPPAIIIFYHSEASNNNNTFLTELIELRKFSVYLLKLLHSCKHKLPIASTLLIMLSDNKSKEEA